MQCFDAFKNLNIAVVNSELHVSPCCVSPTVPTQNIDFEKNTYLTQIRESWKNSQFPAACLNCKNAEDNNLLSRRIGTNQWYQDNDLNNQSVELTRIDYWTGDLCNLACVICGPKYSSVWKQELNFPVQQRRTVVNKFWEHLDLSSIKLIHFNGGEPLLSKEHVAFLKTIPNKSAVTINYNTNGTVKPSTELLDLWQEFKLLQLDFSIDDVGNRFEYQRYPAIWQQVADNLAWYIDTAPHNCMFAVNTSVGILNHSNLENLNQWLQKNFYTSRFTDPIEHRQQLTLGLFALKDADKRKSRIVETLDQIDTRRGTNWRATFPELIKQLSL